MRLAAKAADAAIARGERLPLLGLPAAVAPIDHTETGLPIGIQIIGDYLEDYTTITFAKLLEHEFGSFSMPHL